MTLEWLEHDGRGRNVPEPPPLRLSWSVRRWALGWRARCGLCKKVPASQSLLRTALIKGDVNQVLELLHPEAVHPPHKMLNMGKRPLKARLDFEYYDDFDGTTPAWTMDYICQGIKLSLASRPSAISRARRTDGRRALLLRQLFSDPAHAESCFAQLNAFGAYRAIQKSESGSSEAIARVVTPLHRCAYSGSCGTLQALKEATTWHSWEVHCNMEVPGFEGSPYLPSADLDKCRKHCLESGFTGFVVSGYWAYFQAKPVADLVRNCKSRSGSTVHISPGPRDNITEQAVSALLLAVNADNETPLDVALRRGDPIITRLLASMGCQESALLHTCARELEVLDRVLYGGLPQWLARAVGALPTGGGSQNSEPANVVLEDAEQIRERVHLDINYVMSAAGVSEAEAEALLRHFARSPEAVVGAYRADPVATRRSARLPDINTARGRMDAQASGQCGVCFCDLTLTEAEGSDVLWRHLPCGGVSHPFCDDCIRQYIAGRLQEGDVRGLVCPEPSCRLPFTENAIQAACGAQARERFIQLAASQAVDSAEHLTWCPAPGCGRAVARSAGLTVKCSCGSVFCASCLFKGGHEPATCQQWSAWQKEFPDPTERQRVRREHSNLATGWIEKNAQNCPGCKAIVQRSGGCNHMICRCGVHFCYVCGRPWQEHMSQPGGLNYYRCRLTPLERRQSQGAPQQDRNRPEGSAAEGAVFRFDAASRSKNGADLWTNAAVNLWMARHGKNADGLNGDQKTDCTSPENPDSLPQPGAHQMKEMPDNCADFAATVKQAVVALLAARATMCFSFVVVWDSGQQGQETGMLEMWLGELDGACSTLEAALGPRFCETAALDLSQPEQRAPQGEWGPLCGSDGDVRSQAARLQAMSARIQDLQRLSEAVQRMSGRILVGARSGRCSGPPPGLLGQLGQRLWSWLGY